MKPKSGEMPDNGLKTHTIKTIVTNKLQCSC